MPGSEGHGAVTEGLPGSWQPLGPQSPCQLCFQGTRLRSLQQAQQPGADCPAQEAAAVKVPRAQRKRGADLHPGEVSPPVPQSLPEPASSSAPRQEQTGQSAPCHHGRPPVPEAERTFSTGAAQPLGIRRDRLLLQLLRSTPRSARRRHGLRRQGGRHRRGAGPRRRQRTRRRRSGGGQGETPGAERVPLQGRRPVPYRRRVRRGTASPPSPVPGLLGSAGGQARADGVRLPVLGRPTRWRRPGGCLAAQGHARAGAGGMGPEGGGASTPSLVRAAEFEA
mmetsp:Transcript_99697/g.311197  ORF Transcript_99697/g.311197 Transcript_99697/m.311197 type:complete len:280 (-) Transcript_99697:15-854(-)